MITFLCLRRHLIGARPIATGLFLLLAQLLTLTPTYTAAEGLSHSEIRAGVQAVKAEIAATNAKDFRRSVNMTDPALINALSRFFGMSMEQMIALADRELKGHAITVTPDYSKMVQVKNLAGEYYLKVPARVKVQPPLPIGRETITYIAYKKNGHFYTVDLNSWIARRVFVRIYPEFKGLRLYK